MSVLPHPIRVKSLGRSALLALAMAAGLLPASLGAAGPFNRDAPVDYTADHIDIHDLQQQVVLSGDVVISQDSMRLRASRAVVAYLNSADKNGQPEIVRIDAVGGVQFTRNAESAGGEVAIYDFRTKLLTVTGNVVLRRNGDEMHCARVIMQMNDDSSHFGSGCDPVKGGRVSGRFFAPKSSKP
jgi:lipopolysaccharide export system protein LptA